MRADRFRLRSVPSSRQTEVLGIFSRARTGQLRRSHGSGLATWKKESGRPGASVKTVEPLCDAACTAQGLLSSESSCRKHNTLTALPRRFEASPWVPSQHGCCVHVREYVRRPLESLRPPTFPQQRIAHGGIASLVSATWPLRTTQRRSGDNRAPQVA